MTTILQRFKEGIVNGYKETGDELRNDIPASEGNCEQKQQFDTADDELKSRDPEPNSPTRSPVENLSPEFLAESVEKSTNETKDVFDNTKEDKAMTCVFCNERFPDKITLETHKKEEHTGDRKMYDCSVCEKKFTHRSSRDVHLRVHTGQRPYECKYCKKYFRVSSHLRDHLRTHTGERPFKCDVCGRGFKQSSDMKKHRKTHFKKQTSSKSGPEPSYVVQTENTTNASDGNPNGTPGHHNLKIIIKRERCAPANFEKSMPAEKEPRVGLDPSTKTVSESSPDLNESCEKMNNISTISQTFSLNSPVNKRKMRDTRDANNGFPSMVSPNKIIKSERLSPNSDSHPKCYRQLSVIERQFPYDDRQLSEQQNDEKENDIRQQQVSNTTYEVNSTIFPMNACTFQKQHETNLSGEHANFTEVLTTESADIRHSDMNSHFDEPETEGRLAVDNLATEKTDVVNDVINKNMEQNEQDVAHSKVTSHAGPGKAMESKPSSDKIIREPIRVKDSENKIKCSNCERVLSNMEQFITHKCGKIARCSVCFKGFPRQSLLRQHMVLHQGNKRFRFTCNYCGRAFRHRSHLRDHERIHTGERPFKCSFCPKAFKQSSDHRKHENLHTGTTRYRCEKCSLDFKRCDALKRHAMLHSKGEVTLMKCEKCRSLFATADGHMTHVCQNKPYRYRCQICPKRFTEAENLRRHCYQHHTELFTDSQLRCEFCKMEFENLEKLDKHLTTHRLKKTHKCRTCGQKFSLLNQLVEHVKTHSEAPPSGNDTCNNGEFTPDQEHHEESPSNTATGDSWEGQEPMISSHSPQSIIVHPSPVWPQRQHYYFPMPTTSMEPERRHDYTPSTIRQHTTSRPTSSSPPKQSSNMLQKDALSRSQTFSISRRESPIPLRSFSTSPRSNTAPSKIMPNPAQTSPNALRQFTTSRPNYYDVTNGPIPPHTQIYGIRNEAKTGREVATVIQNTARTTQQDVMTNSNVVDPGKSRERFVENPPIVQENIRANELVNDEKVGEVNPFNYRSNTTNPPHKQNTVDVLDRTFHGFRRHPDDIRMMAGAIRRTPERRHFTNSLKSPVKSYDDFIQKKNELTVEHKNDQFEAKDAKMTISEAIVRQKYTCLNCRSEFTNEHTLVQHVCKMFTEIAYNCEVCEKNFETFEILQRHMRLHWKQVILFKCSLCGERMDSEGSLKDHNMKHIQEERSGKPRSYPGMEEDHTSDRRLYAGMEEDQTSDRRLYAGMEEDQTSDGRFYPGMEEDQTIDRRSYSKIPWDQTSNQGSYLRKEGDQTRLASMEEPNPANVYVRGPRDSNLHQVPAVICSVSGNIVTTFTQPGRDHAERIKGTGIEQNNRSNKEDESQDGHHSKTQGAFMNYYEHKKTHEYLIGLRERQTRENTCNAGWRDAHWPYHGQSTYPPDGNRIVYTANHE